MAIRPRDFFQFGFVVAELETAMQEWELLGYSFCDVFETRVPVDGAGSAEAPSLRMALSREFPHVKLVEASETVSAAAFAAAGQFHVGMWVDDVDQESAAVAAAGLPLVVSGVPDGLGTPWAYHRLLDGSLVELISRHTRPFFQSLLERAPTVT